MIPDRSVRPGIAFALVFMLGLVAAGCAQRSPAAVHSGPYEGTSLQGQAPDFRLVDQNGSLVRLADSRGKVVVLTFMDSQCQEICPLTSVQLRQAHASLEPAEIEQVVFLAVNVNAEANRVEDMQAAMEEWRLGEISNFRFLTGSEPELAPVWEAYGVTVYPAPEETGELGYTPGVFLIDRQGRMRWYVSSPFDEQGNPEEGFAPLSDLLVKRIRELLREG